MALLDGTQKFGEGTQTTVEAAAITCPQCEETVFAQTIGDVTCDTCGHEFYAHDHSSESCTAVECDHCNEPISFVQENRLSIGEWEAYYCYNCHDILAVETADGPQSLERVLETNWIQNDRSLEQGGTEFDERLWLKETETVREQFATELLNIEARTVDSGFHAYYPDSTDAYLCFTDEYCVGYITWNWDSEKPELGQLYLLPEFREQGIGAGFVEAWRDDVVGSDGEFLVNNPNKNMFRLLRSIGAAEVTEEAVEFPGCDISGHWFELPDEWKQQPES